MKTFSRYPLILIVLLYVVANFFMFLNNGRFWDDWCLINPEGIRQIAIGVGIPFMIPIHSWLINLTTRPPQLYHILIGIIEIFGIIIFYKSLLLLKVDRSHSFLITLFFALLPYNSAKITMSTFTYTIGFLFFLLGVLLFIYFFRRNNILFRIASLLFFFLGFAFLPSTLVLALSFFFFMAIMSHMKEAAFNLSYFKRVVLVKLLSWLDFILIPFVFWIFRMFFLMPTGIYAAEGYRGFSLVKIIKLPFNLIVSFVQNFVGLSSIGNAPNTRASFAILFVVMFIVVIYLLKKFETKPLIIDKRVLYLGLFFFFSGVLSYNMVGLRPSFLGFASRHQILLRLATPFLLYYLISSIYSKKVQWIVAGFIVSLFIVSTMSTQLNFQDSWFKQIALEKALSKEQVIRDGGNFVIVDYLPELNENGKYRVFYGYTGILQKTFGNQTRFAIDLKYLGNAEKPLPEHEYIASAFYNMKNCNNISSFKDWVIIKQGSLELSNVHRLRMLYQYYFHPDAFSRNLDKILSLEVLPYHS